MSCIGCLIVGVCLGIAIREAILILQHGIAFDEKLRIYDRKG